MSLCFQFWIKFRLAFLVFCFPCYVLGLVLVIVVFHARDINTSKVVKVRFLNLDLKSITIRSCNEVCKDCKVL
jgi:hypothetical protein